MIKSTKKERNTNLDALIPSSNKEDNQKCQRQVYRRQDFTGDEEEENKNDNSFGNDHHEDDDDDDDDHADHADNGKYLRRKQGKRQQQTQQQTQKKKTKQGKATKLTRGGQSGRPRRQRGERRRGRRRHRVIFLLGLVILFVLYLFHSFYLPSSLRFVEYQKQAKEDIDSINAKKGGWSIGPTAGGSTSSGSSNNLPTSQKKKTKKKRKQNLSRHFPIHTIQLTASARKRNNRKKNKNSKKKSNEDDQKKNKKNDDDLKNAINITSLVSRPLRQNAIIYLVQKVHSTYQFSPVPEQQQQKQKQNGGGKKNNQRRDSFGLLLKSLDLLRDNYFTISKQVQQQVQQQQQQQHVMDTNNYNHSQFDNVDIYLFHTGDYTIYDLMTIESRFLQTTTTAAARSLDTDDNYYNHSNHIQHPHAGIFKLVNLHQTEYWQMPYNLQRQIQKQQQERDQLQKRKGEQHEEQRPARNSNGTAIAAKSNDNKIKYGWLDEDLFPIGYRHMCRFFAIKVWDFFASVNIIRHEAEEGRGESQGQGDSTKNNSIFHSNNQYRYIWRLDEDSFIHSPIDYNIFHFMSKYNYKYGYRLCTYELHHTKFISQWFTKWHEKVMRKGNQSNTSKNGRGAIDWNLCSFYNNFFIADLNFFHPSTVPSTVQQFLYNDIDYYNFIYKYRYGDLLIHTLTLYAYANSKTDIYRFLDFTYQHVTIDRRVNKKNKPKKGNDTTNQNDTNDKGNDDCIIWGSIQAGYNDHPDNVRNVMNRFREMYHIPTSEASTKATGATDIIESNEEKRYDGNRNNYENYCAANISYLTYYDLSPTYNHLDNFEHLQRHSNYINSHNGDEYDMDDKNQINTTITMTNKNHWKETMSLYTISVGQVELPGKGILSG